jgi:hypothetical protein
MSKVKIEKLTQRFTIFIVWIVVGRTKSMDSAVVTLILPSEKSLLGDSPILHMLKSFLNLWTDPLQNILFNSGDTSLKGYLPI